MTINDHFTATQLLQEIMRYCDRIEGAALRNEVDVKDSEAVVPVRYFRGYLKYLADEYGVEEGDWEG